MKTLFIGAVTAIFLLTSGFAQQPVKGKVSGVIKDGKQKGIPFATVMLLKAKDSTLAKGEVTDTNGKYVLDNISEGEYLLSVTILGYKKAYRSAISVSAQNRDIVVPSIEMAEETQNLKEVTVQAQKPFIEQKIDKMVVNVANSIVSSGGNAMEVLERAPGVIVDKDDRISLRGKPGVIIMIDGKPTNLSASDVANMLRNMPSNSIDQIELITNPSAKYDAAGNAGIINIKLKKDKNLGSNGSVTIGVGYGKFEKYNAGINLNHRGKKFNFFGNYNYSYNKRFASNRLERTINSGDQVVYFNQYNYRPMFFNNHSFKGGVDYYLSKKTTLGVMVSGFVTDGGFDIVNETNIRSGQNKVDSSLRMTNDLNNHWENLAYNFNYKTTFDSLGRELSVDLDYSKFNGQGYDNLYTRYYNQDQEETGIPLILRSDIPTEVDIRSAKVDYVHPVSKSTKIEAGIKGSFVITDNNVRFEGFEEGEWSVDANRTNHFKYDENINAAYLNLSTQFKQFGFQFGLRGENTSAKGKSVTLDSTVNRNYFNLFPSVFISQKLSEKHQLSYSYSRRIDRPSYQDLNPFIYFLDPYAYFQGNPFLQPQYTNSFQVAHTFKGAFITTLGYSKTTDVISQVTDQNDETKVTRATMFNLDSYENYSLGINAPVPITKWWRANNNLNIYYQQYQSSYLGGTLENAQFAWTINSNHNITLPKDFSAEVSGMYMSPGVEGIIKRKSMYFVSMGLSKNFMKSKMNLKINVNDIFNIQRFRGTIKYQNMDININSKWETRFARATLTYRFGNNDIKPARRRSTGSEELQNRVKMGN